MLFRMLPKLLFSVSVTVFSFRAMLFRMLPKQLTIIETSLFMF